MADNFDDQRSVLKETLGKCSHCGDIGELQLKFNNSKCNDVDKRSAMDQAFRDKLLELLLEAPEQLENFVTLCIEACRKQMATPTMPVVLLGDIFDATTLDKCEKMFTYVENGVSIWKEELFFGACKNNLLRMCNDLLRRLSRSQNTVFCGRILLFLAKFFPFSERSGLNIVSEFNLDNVTEFSGESSVSLKESLAADEENIIDNSNSKLVIDYNLYCKFWALQDFFRSPNSCYNKIQWKTFVLHSSSVLSAFSSFKLETIELQKSKLRQLKSGTESKEQHYFAKFLTNQKLLELQLSDSNFRRTVLIQFLILFQYLQSNVKFKVAAQELKSDQLDWIRDTTNEIYRLIVETPPDGETFAKCVRDILKREDHWNQWKNDGCKEFKRPKPPMPPAEEETKKPKRRRKLVGDIIREHETQGKVYMGSPVLTKLWNLCPDNLEACKSKERDFMPSLEDFLLKGSARRTSDSQWSWRALRLLARKSPLFFTHSNNPIEKLPQYLDNMIRRISRDVQAAQQSQVNTNGETNASNNSTNKEETKQDESEDVTEEQMEAELIKPEDGTDLEQVPDSTRDEYDYDAQEKALRTQVTMMTPDEMDKVSEVLSEDWKKLATKLGYKADEILFFQTENKTEKLRAKNMLQHWFEDDEDASVENLLYICEGLELNTVCDVLKRQ